MAAVSSRGGRSAPGLLPSPAEARWDDPEPMAEIQIKILRGHSDTVSSCHFCFEDTKILSCSYDRTVKLWDVEKGFSVQIFGEEHTAPISECNLTPDDRRVVTSSYDNTVKAWDMETGKMLWTVEHEGIVTSCNISCDGRYMVSSSDKENTIHVFDAVSATVVADIQGHHKSTITRCCFDPENQRVASVSYDKTIKLWDMIKQSTSTAINEGHSNAISDCCFTSDGHYLCTASWDKSLKIWDIKTGDFQCHEPISLTEGHEGSVSSCVFSQDASLLVSGGYDNTIAIWDTEAGYKKLSLKGHWDWVTDVAISKSKKWILSASKDFTLRLWNIEKMDHSAPVIDSRKARGSKIAQELKMERKVSTGHVAAWNAVKLWNTKKFSWERKSTCLFNIWDEVNRVSSREVTESSLWMSQLVWGKDKICDTDSAMGQEAVDCSRVVCNQSPIGDKFTEVRKRETRNQTACIFTNKSSGNSEEPFCAGMRQVNCPQLQRGLCPAKCGHCTE